MTEGKLVKKEYIYLVLVFLLGIILGVLPFYIDPEPTLHALSSDEDNLHCLFPGQAKAEKIIAFDYPFLAEKEMSVYTIETENSIIEIDVISVTKDDPFIVQTVYNLTKSNLPNGAVIIKDRADDFEIKLPENIGYIRGKIIIKNRKVYRFYSFSSNEFDSIGKYIRVCADVIANS